MKNRLRVHVLRLLLEEKPADISDEVYQKVISYMGEYINDFCSFIFKTLESEFVRKKVPLTDQNIINLLTPTYCMRKSYEYLQYLENSHEYAHDCEREFLAR